MQLTDVEKHLEKDAITGRISTIFAQSLSESARNDTSNDEHKTRNSQLHHQLTRMGQQVEFVLAMTVLYLLSFKIASTQQFTTLT